MGDGSRGHGLTDFTGMVGTSASQERAIDEQGLVTLVQLAAVQDESIRFSSVANSLASWPYRATESICEKDGVIERYLNSTVLPSHPPRGDRLD